MMAFYNRCCGVSSVSQAAGIGVSIEPVFNGFASNVAFLVFATERCYFTSRAMNNLTVRSARQLMS